MNNFETISLKNKYLLKKNDYAACYFCLKVFQVNKITEWVDRDLTALCPFCNIDSVIPYDLNNHEDLLLELKLAKKLYFK
jgi:hypothetical protein